MLKTAHHARLEKQLGKLRASLQDHEDTKKLIKQERIKHKAKVPEFYGPDDKLIYVHTHREIEKLKSELERVDKAERPNIEARIASLEETLAVSERMIEERRLWEGNSFNSEYFDLLELIRTRPLYEGQIRCR